MGIERIRDGVAPQKPKVLIISDEPETARVWGYSLTQIGLDVVLVSINEEPLRTFDVETPDLVIIEDFNTKDEELELCQLLKKEAVIPILYLTSKTTESFFLEAYRVGADECIPLPIGPRLFQAKVMAWLRRTQTIPVTALDEIHTGSFSLEPTLKTLKTPTSQAIKLTALESRLLLVLMSHPGKTLATPQLVERVWGFFGDGDAMLLKNLVYRLRRKIEPDPSRPRYLVRAADSGYRFQADQ
jgi:DNA-binding response OmpR family regulator